MAFLNRILFNSPVKPGNFQPALHTLSRVSKLRRLSTLTLLHTDYASTISCCSFANKLSKKSKGFQEVHLYNGLLRRHAFFSTSVSDPNLQQMGDLVYQGRLGSMLRAVKIFSLATSAISLALQPYLLMTYQDTPLKLAIPIFTIVNFFVFINPILIHYMASKYILELYFNQNNKVFTAVLLTFFAKKEKFTFTAKDVDCPDVPNMFAMFSAKGRPLYAHEEDFTDLQAYKHLLGFDVPLDLTTNKKKT